MQAPKRPGNEYERLIALYNTGLLDSFPEERFDRLTRLARFSFKVPIAMISLVDSERQWFKSSQGLAACEIDREISFCAHTILYDQIFEVSDAHQDPRFADNPLVTGAPYIRFYAGAPLITADGYRLGSLCIIDHKPRYLEKEEHDVLRDLADCVSNELSTHFEELLREEREWFAGNGPVFTMTWSPQAGWPVHYVSENIRNILGYSSSELTAADFQFTDLIHSIDRQRVVNEVRQNIGSGIDTYEQSYRLRLKRGAYRWFYGYNKVMRNQRGEVDNIRGYMFDQTQLKESEKALNTERRRLSEIIEGVQIGTWELSVKTGKMRINERSAEIIGYNLEELEPVNTQTLINLVHPDDVEKIHYLLGKCFKHELESYDCETRIKHKKGHWVWVHDRGKVVGWTDDDKPLLVSGTYVDISERKNAEQAINEFSEFQKLVFENMPLQLFVKDEQGRIVLANSRFLNLFPEHLRSGIDCSEKCREQLLKNDRRAFGTGFFEVEETVNSSTGEMRTFWTKRIRFKNAEGQSFILGVMMDITDRKSAEAARNALRKRLSVATRASGMGIWEWDVANNVLEWDDKMFQLFGIEKSQFVNTGDAWLEWLHPQDRERVKSEIRLGLHGEQCFDTDFRIVSADGEVRHVKAAAIVERDSNAKPVRMIGTKWDITQLKNAESELVKAKEAAEIAANSKSEFLANMSHEIRIDLPKLLSDITMSLVPAVHEKGLQIVLDAADVEENLVVGDPNRLRQILTNLLSNAIKFTMRGEIFVLAGLKDVGNENLEFNCSVTDSGIGIEPEKIPKLFDPFSQADSSTTRNYGGTGLGLSIVKQLCRLMDGGITASSSPHRGSSFNFHILLKKRSLKSKRKSFNLDRLKVFVIDQHEKSRETIRRQMEAWGVTVSAFASLKLRDQYADAKADDKADDETGP
ncbi:MAG: PAS domain-containing protein [Exilibacterium sp.]